MAVLLKGNRFRAVRDKIAAVVGPENMTCGRGELGWDLDGMTILYVCYYPQDRVPAKMNEYQIDGLDADAVRALVEAL